jgi:ABC-type Fe3+ transport system substrate-binding protein
MIAKISIVALLAVILGIPFLMSVVNRTPPPPAGSRTLLVVTPHVPQIRREFAEAFERWHLREYGQPVRVDMRTPGGTSEILTQLEAQIRSEIKRGHIAIAPDGRITIADGAAAYDLMFGGGSYDHSRLKSGVKVTQPLLADSPLVHALGLDRIDPLPDDLDAEALYRSLGTPAPRGVRIYRDGSTPMLEVSVPMSQPVGLDPAQLESWFGDNRIGAQQLYDEDQYWIGTALSSFGIVYNRDLCERLGVGVPDSFRAVADPRLIGEVALADPRMSGSITTTFDSILGYYGWEQGWRILRAMSANTRYFTNSSTKPPMDVSQGEAAVGLAIDFYGRGQAQAVGGDRVGYAEPAGAVYIDADPISVLNGAPNADLARRFVRFVLSDEGQALWQFPAVSTPAGADNPRGPDGRPMGPQRYELRRMPVRRDFIAARWDALIDQVDPFAIASDTQNPGWRTGVQIMMGAFAIDAGHELRQAWAALARARRTPGFDPEVLAEMERNFYAFPTQARADGSVVPFDQAHYDDVRAVWRDPIAQTRARIAYVRFFRERFAEVVDLSHSPARPPRKVAHD